MGSLSCLNVAGGDIRISFDTDNASEAIRAKRIIADMLKRGYALMIEVDGAFQRAVGFDEKVGEYVLADYDSSVEVETSNGQEKEQTPALKAAKKGSRRRVAMATTNAVGVARSAGG